MNTQRETQGTSSEGTALQQRWLELLSTAMQATFGYYAGSPQFEPHQLRTSSLEGWTKSWKELLHSYPLPHALKQWMENTDPIGTKADAANSEKQGDLPGRSSAELESAIMLVCQMQKSLLGKIEQLSEEIVEVNRRLEYLQHKDRAIKSAMKQIHTRGAQKQHGRAAWKSEKA